MTIRDMDMDMDVCVCASLSPGVHGWVAPWIHSFDSFVSLSCCPLERGRTLPGLVRVGGGSSPAYYKRCSGWEEDDMMAFAVCTHLML